MNRFGFGSTTAYLLLVLSPFLANAQDRVWLEPPRPTSAESDWFPRAIQQLDGKVLEFDAKQLKFVRLGDEAETNVASRRVIWIESGNRSPLEDEAIKLFVEGDFAACLSKLPAVLRERPPVWRQQRITMLAANAAWQSGRSRIGLELVAQLDRLPLPPATIAWLPVAWSGGRQSADAVKEAKNRLSDPSPAAQLVAASWLLSSPERNRATAVLKTLSTHQREEIAWLAQALLWRVATPPEVVELNLQWQAQLDALPMAMQVGPTKTLIDKLRAARRTDEANRLQWSLDLTPIHPHL